MISTNDVKPGMALDLPEGLCKVVDYQHVKPGKGKAFVRMKLKNLSTGAVVDKTFRAGENLPKATIDRSDFQYLYRDENGLHIMNMATYEQTVVPLEVVADELPYLVEGATIQVNRHDDRPIGVDLPASVELEVTYAEPGVKGDRVSGATKPVTLQTDLVIQAPLFVEVGDIVKVDTRTGSYITRVS
ncbi:MAG: elongation factor P [Acidimicrobiia bacterium]|nr:elongation factor P [Acidimicrobiia bacterium]MBT8214266.1 elongation factor P [Acidimicrobiia bacterium]NNF69411.1 elongation factor P [Acidimicrobiia bacterium]NNK91934.1 elongation factor P [Acidimicrobiia bacterium]